MSKPTQFEKLGNKVFVAARHGCHNRTHNLNAKGMAQMGELAVAVRKVATKRGLSVEILSSTEPCALYGAKVIARELGIDPDKVMAHDCFWADNHRQGDLELAVGLVEPLFREGKLLLLISNVAMSHRIVRRIFGAMMSEVEHGTGFMVARKGVSIIPRPPHPQ